MRGKSRHFRAGLSVLCPARKCRDFKRQIAPNPEKLRREPLYGQAARIVAQVGEHGVELALVEKDRVLKPVGPETGATGRRLRGAGLEAGEQLPQRALQPPLDAHDEMRVVGHELDEKRAYFRMVRADGPPFGENRLALRRRLHVRSHGLWGKAAAFHAVGIDNQPAKRLRSAVGQNERDLVDARRLVIPVEAPPQHGVLESGKRRG